MQKNTEEQEQSVEVENVAAQKDKPTFTGPEPGQGKGWQAVERTFGDLNIPVPLRKENLLPEVQIHLEQSPQNKKEEKTSHLSRDHNQPADGERTPGLNK